MHYRPRQHKSSRQSLGADNKSNRDANGPEDRHKLQHAERREERGAHQRVPQRVPVPALPGHGAQAVPAAARPQRSVDGRHRLLLSHSHDRLVLAAASAH